MVCVWATEPLSFLHLQEPAGTVLAAIGQFTLAANGGSQNGFVALALEAAARWGDRNLEWRRHRLRSRQRWGILGVLCEWRRFCPQKLKVRLRWPICPDVSFDMGWMWSPRELCVDDLPAPEQHPSSSLVCPKEFMSTVALSSGLGALPARFRRERLLIVGCGRCGHARGPATMRRARCHRVRVMALTSSPERKAALRGCLSRRSWETWTSLPRCAAGWAGHAGSRLAPPPEAKGVGATRGGAIRARWRWPRCACNCQYRWRTHRPVGCMAIARGAGAKRAPCALPHAPSAVWMLEPLFATWAGLAGRPKTFCAFRAFTRLTGRAERPRRVCSKGTPVLEAWRRRHHQPHPCTDDLARACVAASVAGACAAGVPHQRWAYADGAYFDSGCRSVWAATPPRIPQRRRSSSRSCC